MMRLLTDYFLPEADNSNSPEIDEFCWIRRVCPGDKLIMRVTVTGSLRSMSEPCHGIVHSFIEVLNQNREVVMSMIMKNILLCSPK
jgi:acyl dehydratase